MPAGPRRRPRRGHRRRRLQRWLRALGPILLLLAAGLLSAGVVQIVESTTPAAGPGSQGAPAPGASDRIREIDLERFDRELLREWRSLERPERDVSWAPGVTPHEILGLCLGQSLVDGPDLGDAFRPEIRAGVLYEGRGRTPDAAPRSSRSTRPGRGAVVPEPSAGWLVAFGLGLLSRISAAT